MMMEETHVVVVGGGLMGLSVAIHCARNGLTVSLLEKDLVGSGQTSKSGGQIIDGYALGFDEMVKKFDYSTALALQDFSRESVDALYEELKDTDAISGHGNLIAIVDGESPNNLIPPNTNKYVVDSDKIKDYIDSPMVRSGVFDWESFHVNPENMVDVLKTKAIDLGVRIYEYSTVEKITGKKVKTNLNITFSASHIVVTAGLGTDDLILPKFLTRVQPIKTLMGVIFNLDKKTMENDYCVYDNREVPTYFRQKDQVLYFGCCDTQKTMSWVEKKYALEKEYERFFPNTKMISFGRYQAEFDATITRLPHVEKKNDYTYIAYGLNGHGLALAYGIGKEIANDISNTKTEYFSILISNLKAPVFPKMKFLGRLVVTTIISFKKIFNKI